MMLQEMIMDRFSGRTVLVTGGTSGIGLATALAFKEEGARVIVTGRGPQALEAAGAALGAGSIVIRNDASDPESPAALAASLASASIRLDAVFINAGIAKFAPIGSVGAALWDETFAINVKGPFFLIQALLPLLNKGASIVLNGSVNARIGMPNSSVYAASKAALISLARTLSGELVARGVRVNVVSPGPVETPLYSKLELPAHALKGMAEQLQAQIPIGRFGRSEEIAATVLHLAAPESAFIVGTEIVADGGMSEL
jgi:NAD(P)-dependent dehydrogenase (short-subunit alcohol dehydrogenase family)